VDATTGHPSSFASGIRESYAAIRAELADDELAGSMFEDRPVQDFGHGHEAHVQRKLTKTRERPRIARCRLKMMSLDPMHPSRMSFLEASGQAEGAAVRAVLSSWPSASRPFTPIQWVTGFELLFGCPITALAQFEGSRIGSTKWTCDKHGHRLTATQVRGDHWRERHDAVNWALGRFATACQVPMTIEVYDLLCQHISQPGRLHFSGMHSRSHRQGKIPDGVFHLAQDYLYELKTISAASSRHGHASGDSAVDKRANKINAEYMTTAHEIDVRWNATIDGQQGPFETALRQYGDGGDHCIQGLCVGMFGGISSGITSLLRILAQHGAERLIQRMGSSSMKHCQATLLWLARRDLGAVLWTANADLILHRIQHLGGAATRERSRQRHAQHRFFPAGDPAAATWAHRNAAAGFDGHADARRWRAPFAQMGVVGAGPPSPPTSSSLSL
jgi:hypothetical protein